MYIYNIVLYTILKHDRAKGLQTLRNAIDFVKKIVIYIAI